MKLEKNDETYLDAITVLKALCKLDMDSKRIRAAIKQIEYYFEMDDTLEHDKKSCDCEQKCNTDLDDEEKRRLYEQL